MTTLTRFRWIAIALVVVGVVASLAGVRWSAAAHAQLDETATDTDILWRDIRFLELARELELTAEQRKAIAGATGAFQDQRKAIMALAQPEELAAALADVRASLLKGEAPTDEQRQAVAQARPPDDGSVDQAFTQARQTCLAAIKATLTDEQTMHMTVRPMVELANEMLMMAAESREVSAAEREDWRTNSFADLRGQLAEAAGEDAGIVLADLQARIDHLFTLTPEQIEAQRDELVAQVVTTINGALSRNTEVIEQRLDEQLLRWATEPGLGALLAESATAMEQ